MAALANIFGGNGPAGTQAQSRLSRAHLLKQAQPEIASSTADVPPEEKRSELRALSDRSCASVLLTRTSPASANGKRAN